MFMKTNFFEMLKGIKVEPYKLIFLLLLSIFIYCSYLNSKNGRFLRFNDTNTILDTRNGKLYTPLNYNKTVDSLFIVTDPIIK